MFTQCSKCETVFRLSADALRAAGGQVRCGRCGEVFNALSRLAEDASGFTKGESPLFLETRADEILESSSSDLSDPPLDPADGPHDVESVDLDLPPGVEAAQLQFIGAVDDELAEETSLEFTLPPGELDRIFIESRPRPLQQLNADSHRTERADVIPLHPEAQGATPFSGAPSTAGKSGPGPSGLGASGPGPSGLGASGPGPSGPGPSTMAASAAAPPAAAPSGASPANAGFAAAGSPAANSAGAGSSNAGTPDAALRGATSPNAATPRLPPPPTRISGLEVSEDVRQAMLSSLREDAGRDPSLALRRSRSQSQVPDPATRARLPFAAWLTAAIVLGILLLVQVVRGNSDWVALHVPLLGGPGRTAADLSVYQLRQWGVTGDPGAKGTLRVRASIMNTAAQLQPYPLLRVSLVNRFGTRVGAREFEPAEYLGHPITRMLAPGERVDATLDILDPGKDAEGFEIDVCIRRGGTTIACAGDAQAGGPAAGASPAHAQ